MPFAVAWTGLEIIILGKVSQTEEAHTVGFACMMSLTCGI